MVYNALALNAERIERIKAMKENDIANLLFQLEHLMQLLVLLMS